MPNIKRLIKYKGKTMTIPQWAKWQGIPEVTLRYRIYAGWSVEEALNGKPKITKKVMRRTDESLCWLCGRTAANCPWVHRYKPVKDWDAEKTELKGDNGLVTTSYRVLKCPLFIKNEKVQKERST